VSELSRVLDVSDSTVKVFNPQDRAWGILWLSFAVFCLVCLAAGVSVTYFLFQSTVPLDAGLYMGRGTASVSNTAATSGEYQLSDGNSIDIVFPSQGTIFFRDGSSADRLIATVTIRGDTRFTVQNTDRPRFDWGTGGYRVTLSSFRGEVDVFVVEGLSRPLELNVITERGDRAQISESGQYTLVTSPNQVRLLTSAGAAVLKPALLDFGTAVPPNNRGTIVYGEETARVDLSPAYINLVTNSTFQDLLQIGDGDQVADVAPGWGCYNGPNDVPQGQFSTEPKDGRYVMRFFRDDGAEAQGSTGCIANWGRTVGGIDVSDYSYLAIRASFFVDYQSVSLCGQQASECPVMVQIQYVDQEGDLRRWTHGFYYLLDPNYSYPLQCDTCTQEHERINEKAWFTYDSGNLLTLFPPQDVPVSIVNAHVYASGHQYDVYIGEMALLAGQAS
jgi:hypothetical protein